MITRGVILVGIVLVLEVLLLFGFSLCFFTDFGFFFRRKIFFKRDLLLVLGYLVLIGGTIYASIRSLLHDWFVFLISMKSTYLLLLIVSFMILSLGHLFWIGSTNFSLKGLR